jgi:hypothetical protein
MSAEAATATATWQNWKYFIYLFYGEKTIKNAGGKYS